MNKETRQGLGLVVVAVALALVGAALDLGPADRLVFAAGVLLAIGGLVVVAVGLFRTSDG